MMMARWLSSAKMTIKGRRRSSTSNEQHKPTVLLLMTLDIAVIAAGIIAPALTFHNGAPISRAIFAIGWVLNYTGRDLGEDGMNWLATHWFTIFAATSPLIAAAMVLGLTRLADTLRGKRHPRLKHH